MFYVEIQFANRADRQTFATAQEARIFAGAVGYMYKADEIYRVENTWIVAILNMKVEYV